MNKTQKTSIYGLFSAIIVVLQLLSYSIKIGTFNLSLVLVPVVLGAYLYGRRAGLIFGTVFGIVVYICCVTGMDAGGFILFAANPLLTALICIVKGAATGYFSGLVGDLFKKFAPKREYLAIVLSAITAPIVNTGLFIAGLSAFFSDILKIWANGSDVITYIFVGLIGINFLIELFVNSVAGPSLLRITKALKRI